MAHEHISTDMEDIIADLSPGDFDSVQFAEVLAVFAGIYLLHTGHFETGLLVIAIAVGGENAAELIKHEP